MIRFIHLLLIPVYLCVALSCPVRLQFCGNELSVFSFFGLNSTKCSSQLQHNQHSCSHDESVLIDLDSFDSDDEVSFSDLEKIDHLPFSSIHWPFSMILETYSDPIEPKCQFLFFVQPVPKYIQYCSYLI